MDISALTATAAQGPQNKSLTGLADDFSSFLKLLTTQLQNQDPTSPMDADQFTQQLVQFSGVEQQIRSNETLGELAALMQADQLSQSVGYLGAEVEAEGDVFRLGDDGQAKIHYELESAASTVLLKITDEFGQVVALKPGELGAGRHSLTWDGIGDDGVRHTDGSYKVEVLAQSAAGTPVAANTTISGIVDGVEIDGAETMLSVDGILMSMDRISAVRTASTAA
ncbi:MAG: flagellar biosynthesis protein FlgD [Alphaproteobacteria bacterium]|nr:flagellar biosynthesis protein FlgD [Alphaproteobacteria bacterium]